MKTLVSALTCLAFLTACGPLTPAEKTILHDIEIAVCAGLKPLDRLPEGIDAAVCAIAGDPKTTAANEAAVRTALDATTKAAPKTLVKSTVYHEGKAAGTFTNRRAIMAMTFPAATPAPAPTSSSAAPAAASSAPVPALPPSVKAVVPPASSK